MTILTAVDGEQVPSKAVETGHELATAFDEEHVVLHVMSQELYNETVKQRNKQTVTTADLARFEASPLASDVSYGKSQERSGGSSDSSSKYTVEDAESDAAVVASDVVDATLDDAAVTLQGRVGEPVEEILAEAERRDARYLVLGGRKRTPVGKALFGSVTQSVLLGADLPVMSVMRQD